MNRAKSSCSGSDDGGGMVEAIMVVVAQRGVIVVTMTVTMVVVVEWWQWRIYFSKLKSKFPKKNNLGFDNECIIVLNLS